ncbi:uncharacterized protein TM35_000332400 [Trypanosoma theileri]|uniref:Uncharacterized protein n=1 Tax=Trypanosoma theileri TaxID=67003 RepID=A0A1X0NMR3_9TRYP|nr:uncharacterized protein TM35_000332400 [Trypanosoma theileri]ORC85783.1 hypothetical protein TM35_000332400 [Trypanosoma theileri]
MTTISVQLRGVVYLFVLMQCFSDLVRAQEVRRSAKEVATTVVNNSIEVEVKDRQTALGSFLDIPKYTDDDLERDEVLMGKLDLKIAVRIALRDLSKSEDLFKRGTACISEWDKVVAANEKAFREAKEATEKIGVLVARAKKIKEEAKTVKSDTKNTKAKELNDVFVEIRDLLKGTKDRAPNADTVFKIVEADHAERICLSIRHDVEYVMGDLKQRLEGITTYKGEYESCDKAVKVKSAVEKVHGTLKYVTNLIGNATVHDRFSVGKAKAQVEVWKKAYTDLAAMERLVVTQVGDGRVETEFEVKANKVLDEIQNDITAPKTIIDNSTDKKNEGTVVKKKKIVEEVNRRVDVATKAVGERIVEEKKEIAEERARKAAEEARKAAEEAKRKRDEEEKRRQEAAQKAREEEAREAVERDREVDARLAGEKVRENAAREVAEKAKKEAELAREKAKKKKDGGNGPALVHSSMLLLVLLTGLGYTLMC